MDELEQLRRQNAILIEYVQAQEVFRLHKLSCPECGPRVYCVEGEGLWRHKYETWKVAVRLVEGENPEARSALEQAREEIEEQQARIVALSTAYENLRYETGQMDHKV